jgi:hypothetical protein
MEKKLSDIQIQLELISRNAIKGKKEARRGRKCKCPNVRTALVIFVNLTNFNKIGLY